jgi:hypothetical protein
VVGLDSSDLFDVFPVKERPAEGDKELQAIYDVIFLVEEESGPPDSDSGESSSTSYNRSDSEEEEAT